MELTEVILQHVLVTAIIVLAGLLIGGGLGFLFGWIFKQLFKAVPGLQPPFMLLPWRTLLFSVMLFFVSPMAFIQFHNFDSQVLLSGLFPGVTFALIAFFFTLEATLTHWLPFGLASRLTALARTLAVACGVLIATILNTRAGIMGYAYMELARTFRPDAYWIALAVVMGLGLTFDLLLGTVQMLFAFAERKRAARQAAGALEK